MVADSVMKELHSDKAIPRCQRVAEPESPGKNRRNRESTNFRMPAS